MPGQGDDLHKPRAGDTLAIPATLQSTLIDMATEYRAARSPGNSTRSSVGLADPAIVLIQNNTGSNVAQFGILGIDTPIVDHATNPDTFNGRVMLNGVTPNGASNLGRFVITLQPIAASNTGSAIIAGAVQAKIDVQNASDGFADIESGNLDQLKSGPTGAAQILWKEAGLGPVWGIVRLIGQSLPAGQYQFQVYGDVSQNQTGFDFVRGHSILV